MTDPRKSTAIAAHVTVQEVIGQERHIHGTLALARLSRLTEALEDSEGLITVSLQCRADMLSLGRIQGSLGGPVKLRCQRCLQVMPWQLEAEADWTLVDSEADEERLLESRDPVMVSDGQLDLHAAIEDELLLAVPLVPHCTRSECVNNFQANDEEVGDNRRPGDARVNPFAALKSKLKH